MATRVGLAKIWMTPFDRPTPKTPSLVQNSETYLKCEMSYGKFCVEISKFSFPWQQGLVWHKFSLTQLNWRTQKPPIWCKNIDDIAYTNWVMADFVSKWRQLVAMATRVGLTEIWIIPFDCPPPKTPSLVQSCKHLARIFNGTRVMALRSCHRP